MDVMNARHRSCGFALGLALACASPPSLAERDAGAADIEQGIRVGRVERFASRVLSEQRELRIYLPETYATATFRYPVLYLLDAEGDFLHTAGIVEFLGGIDRIPELILVGVVNTHRSRDLTPPSDDEEETAFWDEVGGAGAFQRMLREELIPFIDSKYRTEPFRILRGQSFGGLFAIHDAMSQAPVFDAVIASSPAVGWNHGKLVKAAPELFSAGVSRPLYVASAGKDFPGNLRAIEDFARIVDAAGGGGKWLHEHFETEGHYSLHHRSTYRGLEFLYASWQVPDDVAETADFAAYERHFAALSKRFGYRIRIPMRSIVRLGNQRLRARDFDQGIAVFERALEIYSDLPEAHWRVGEAYRLAGRLAEARPHLVRAYRLAAEQSAPDLADYRRALEDFDRNAGRKSN